MQITLSRKKADQQNRQPEGAWMFSLPEHNWRDTLLWAALAFFLVLVVVVCTIGPSPLILIAMAVILAVALVAVARPPVAICLVSLGAAFPALLLPVPGHLVRPVEGALLLCVLAVIARPVRMRLRLPHLLALLFIGIAIVSFIHVPTISTDPHTYAADKRLYNWFLILVTLFCGTLLVKYVKNLSGFLTVTLLCSIPVFLVCLAQARHIHLPLWLETSGASDPKQTQGRLWGPFDWSTTLGLYLINIFAVALCCWLLGTRRRDRIIGFIMAVAAALAEVGSGSRAATLAIGVIAVLAFLLLRRYKMLFGTLLLAGAGSLIFLNKVLQLFLHPATSASNRLFLWQEALKLIGSNPWIGIGLEQFPRYYTQLIVSQASQLNARGIAVHNMYLEWAMEGGILWLVVGLLLLFSILSVCWKAYHRAPEGQRIILLAVWLAVIGNLIGGLFEAPMDQTEAAVSLFMLIGLALGYAEPILWGKKGKWKCVPSLPFSVSRIAPGVANGTPRTLAGEQQASLPSSRRRAHSEMPTASLPTTVRADDSAPSTRKTGRTVFIQLLSWGITIPIIFPTTALLTRYFGPVQYGEYNFALPYISVFAYLSGIGMDAIVIRELSRRGRKKWSDILSYALGTRLFFTLAGAGVAVVGALVLPVSAEERKLLLLGSVSLIFSFSVNGLRMIYSNGFRAEQRVITLTLIETTNRLITAGLVVVVVLLRLSLVWAYVLIVYSDVPFFILQVWIARRRYRIRMRFSLERVRKHLFAGLPLMGYNVMILIGSQIDVFFLYALASVQSVGIYALAMRITDPLLTIVVAYGTGVYPLLCTKFEEGRKQFSLVYRESTRILALAIIPLAIIVSVEARQIVLLLGGQSFSAAAIAVQLLMWAMAATFFGQLAVRACMAANKERLIPYVTAISVSVNVVANLVLIPRWNIVGAGVAALTSEFTGLCLFSFLVRRHVHLLSVIWVMLRVFLGSLPALVFLLWQQHSPLLAVPIALGLLVAGCMATRTLSLKDVRMVRHMLFDRETKKLSGGVAERATAALPAFADWPTNLLPVVSGDIAERPTLLLPRVKI